MLDVQLTLDRISNCQTFPCPANATASVEQANKEINETHADAKEYQDEIDGDRNAIKACKVDNASFLPSFVKQVEKHKLCRDKQSSADQQHKDCQKQQDADNKLRDTTCTSGIYAKTPADLVTLCQPGIGVALGPWLRSTWETFETTTIEWVRGRDVCLNATNAAQSTATRCTKLAKDLESQATICEQDLANIETFTCSQTTEHAVLCREYDSCYNDRLATYQAKVKEVPGRIEKWRGAVEDLEKLKCFANAVTSKGEPDAAQMNVCRNKTYMESSKISVTTGTVPARKSCDESLIYPGSRLYKTNVYRDLPKSIQIRDPIVCLTWKGGCSEYSTFNKAPILLKYNGKYCNVQTTGRVGCDDQKQTFMFQHEATPQGSRSAGACKQGKVTLSMHPSGAECRYDPLAGLPKLSCGSQSVAGNTDFTATLIDNELANGRKGKVILAFAGTSVRPFAGFEMRPWTDWDAKFEASCTGGKKGALRGVISKHNNNKEDRIFQWQCAYTRDGFSDFQDAYSHMWTDFHQDWQQECSNKEVITRVEAYHENQKEDRRYIVTCGKTPQGMGLDLKPWTDWTNKFDEESKQDCGEDGVLVGIKTRNSKTHWDRIWAYRCATVSISAPPQLSFQVEYSL